VYQIFDGESANTAAGKPLNISSGSPGIRSLVQRFDTAAASAGGRPSFGGPRQGRPVGREDWQTPGMDRASRSRSLAARWTATDVLPTKPRWMTSTKQASRVDDFVKQRQVMFAKTVSIQATHATRIHMQRPQRPLLYPFVLTVASAAFSLFVAYSPVFVSCISFDGSYF